MGFPIKSQAPLLKLTLTIVVDDIARKMAGGFSRARSSGGNSL